MENEKIIKKIRRIFRKIIRWKKIKGFNLSPMEIYMLRDIYNEILNKECSTFLNSNIKEVLNSCGIKTEICGIGYRVVL